MSRVDYKEYILESADDLYENAPCGYLSFLPDGTIVKINKTLLNWLGYKRKEVLFKKKFIDFLAIGGKIFYETHFAPLLKLQGFANEINFDLLPKADKPVPVLANTIQLRNENAEPQMNRATLFNITDRKKYEQELLLAKKKAEAATKVKADFISTFSHEIRTPMNAIIGITDILLKTNPTPPQLEYLNILKYSADSLLNLINDVLDLSKIEAGQATLNPRTFNLRELVNSLVYSFNVKAEEKNIDLEVHLGALVPTFVIADEVKIRQILNNLLGNAVKFTDTGWVKLEVAVLETEKDAALLNFKVIDTGIGIPEDKLTVIFEEFAQATTDTEQQFGGTGLGLTITKRILNLFNSKIDVQSEPGRGTIFSFDLKLKTTKPVAKPSAAQVAESTAGSLKGIKLLLVEDNNINILVTEQYLKNWGVDYEIVRDGLQAISKINQTDFDLILMDLQMPVMNGYEAAKWIRNLPEAKYRQLPIIALSASAKSDLDQQIKECGFTNFVNKPFKPEELYNKIALYTKKTEG
ncbi:PAS domain-containing hybrid sensor histidine kinase/response regulator [Adhaeribacter rhizoryzae]|uniref:Sensory/regulatory protein RpfC n=1 Tax=Adhaeribacter rhizoryzae TaxID=2607907 RepID=A0A5M6DMR3_9BACT|nr:PAS domain-containing hybrid sensor histidine kinase/response regulator [Adhaeribacter rhizoryzae]KAA5546695.1 response regulator [Adhaeribacter rhizoryzae]